MNIMISILILIIPILASYLYQFYLKHINDDDIKFGEQFLKLFNDYMNSKGTDISAYTFMTKNSNRMQNQLGNQGYITMRQPGIGIISNYTIILTGLPQIQNYLLQNILRDDAYQIARLIVASILRSIGDIERKNYLILKHLKNPFIMYRIGWQLFLSIPLYILKWFGIITSNFVNILFNNYFFKLLTGLFALLSLLGSVMTIILGWEDFLKFVLELIK